MRRALASLCLLASALCAALLPAPSPAGAESASSLRTRRAALLARIADLTDRLDADEARVLVASDRREQASDALRDARAVVQHRAVAAYVDGLARSFTRLTGTGSVYLAVAVAGDRRAVATLRDARDVAASQEADAEAARDRTRAAAADLDRARQELESTLAVQEKLEADEVAAAARRAAMAAGQAAWARALADGTGPYLPRHRIATERQAEVMGRYPFGPVAGGPGAVPDGLRRTGGVVDGQASWYGPGFDGHATASGAIYDQDGWTCASKELPLGTFLLVSRGDRSVLLLVNDRGPYVEGRVLDLSHAAAGYLGVGVADVHAELVAPA